MKLLCPLEANDGPEKDGKTKITSSFKETEFRTWYLKQLHDDDDDDDDDDTPHS